MQQLALAFEARHVHSDPARRQRRRRGLRLEGRPVRRRDLKPANVPIGYGVAYQAQLAEALRYPDGPSRRRALLALADPAPFDLAADLLEEAEALGWLHLAQAGRCDQAAE